MNRKLNLTLLVASSMLIALTGCTLMHDDMADSDSPTEQKGDVYVRLNLSMAAPGGTRAYAKDAVTETSGNPNGGEQGDGEEAGQDYENKIDNVRLFFFEKPQGGVNTASAETITFTRNNMVNFLSLSSSDNKTYTSTPVPLTLTRGKTYNVLAVANLSASEWLEIDKEAQENPEQPLTLAMLRDKIQKRAWSGDDIYGYSNFVMATADMPEDVKVETDKGYPYNDPLVVKTDVERHAARVDYKASGDYECSDPSYKGATVTIVGAALINNLTGGTYMFKRVSSEINGTPDYLGKETPDVGINTNYVIDPWSTKKTLPESDEMKAVYGEWRYETHPNAEDWAAYVKEGTTLGGETNVGYRSLGYTMENTMSVDNTDKHYATGVVFKAKFKPAAGSVEHYADDGSTFFVFDNKIYASIEDILEFGKNLNLENDLKAAYGYSCDMDDKGIAHVTINQDGKNTRELLAHKGIKVYENATCYYIWWIRHSNNQNDETNGKMEYAIVRNNVYKLNVESIYSIGGTVPEDGNIKVRVYVKNWTLLPGEELEM